MDEIGAQTTAETANGAQGQNAGLTEGQKRYVSVNARYDGERATNAVKALQEKDKTAKIYSGELTSEQEETYTIAKRIVNNINQTTGDDIALIVVSGDMDFNALNVKSGNAILISEKTLANTHGAVDALAKILFEEATHSTQTTDTIGRYNNAWYGVLFHELAENNSATMESITERLLASGNSYGFTQETLDSMEQKLDRNERLSDKEQELLDEIGAQTVGEILGGNKEIIEKYAGNKSAAEKILGVFGKIKKALSRANSKEAKAERARVERVEGMLLNALAEKGLTYQNGKVISVRPPEEKEDGNERFNLDNYTEKQYNDYGWARENDILTASENSELRSKFAQAKNGQYYPQTKSGEYMIEVGKTGNKIAFMRGTITNPVISSVIEIDAVGMELDEKRREVYESERRGIQQEAGGILERYDSADFRDQQYGSRNRAENVNNNNGNGLQRGRGSASADGVKGKVYYSESENVRFSKGQNAKVAANNTGERVYSKKLARAAIEVITESNLVFGDEYSTLKGTIKGKGAMIDQLFYKLNRTQNKDYQRAVANKVAMSLTAEQRGVFIPKTPLCLL